MAKGSFFKSSSSGYLSDMKKHKVDRAKKVYEIFKKYGPLIVKVLEEKTPKDTGLMSKSWRWEAKLGELELKIYNDDLTKEGLPTVFLVIYGRRTSTGKYIEPNNFVERSTRDLLAEMRQEIGEVYRV